MHLSKKVRKAKCTRSKWPALIALLIIILSLHSKAMAQDNNHMVRLAKIIVDPAKLDAYNTALKEQMTAAVRTEPGALTYYAVADKQDPSKITILEIYTDTVAYQAHIQTSHFKKYKETVKDMVKSLELEDVQLIGSAKKPGM